MRNFLCVLLACLVSLSPLSVADAKNPFQRKVKLPVHSRTTAYSVQTMSVSTGCFSPKLQGVLAHIAAKTGQRPVVTSGHRPRSGRARSQHRYCKAADIRVPGVPEKKILAAALSAPGIGGIGRYCNGIIHVDIGPKRRWVDC